MQHTLKETAIMIDIEKWTQTFKKTLEIPYIDVILIVRDPLVLRAGHAQCKISHSYMLGSSHSQVVAAYRGHFLLGDQGKVASNPIV